MSFDRIIAITRQYGSGGHDIVSTCREAWYIVLLIRSSFLIAAKESGVSPDGIQAC